MGMSYDRRVPDELLKALEPGGFAHSLVEFGDSGMWALDLQLRGLGKIRKQYRATLYVGMYADLFQRWADHADGKAYEVLYGMAAQRRRIGLSSGAEIELAAPVKVRPVVALDRRAKSAQRRSLPRSAYT